ncbi:MAG: hypothetical protein MJZ53_05740 [Paludibacteraceae bacterium]|nr:hypothetical protein [Paludibacteraceae bacterium]
MKRIALFIIFAFTAVIAIAEETVINQAMDLIYTTKNEIVEAKILEISAKEVRYKEWANQDGPIFVLTTEEIRRIYFASGQIKVYNDAATSYDSALNPSFASSSIRGLQVNIDLGGVITSQEEKLISNTTFVSGGVLLDLGLGYRFNKSFYLGAVFGVSSEWGRYNGEQLRLSYGRNYEVSASEWIMPIYLDARAYIPMTQKVNPFIEIGLGGFIGLSGKRTISYENYEEVQTSKLKVPNGLYVSLGAGIALKYLTVSAGYRLLHSTSTTSGTNNHYGYVKVGVNLNRKTLAK